MKNQKSKMELSVLKREIDDLKMIMLRPKLFISNYFEELINQLDISTVKFEIKNAENFDRINKADDYRHLLIKRFNEIQSDLLAHLDIDDDVKEIEIFIEKKIEKLDNQKYVSKRLHNSIKKQIEKYSFRLKAKIMANQSIIVLNDRTVEECGKIGIESFDFWKEIMPVLRINGFFMDKKFQPFRK